MSGLKCSSNCLTTISVCNWSPGYAGQGCIFVDVGAHIGPAIFEVLYFDQRVRIIAIEPVPEKFGHSRKQFRSIDVRECAVAEEWGWAELYVDTKRSGYSSLSASSKGLQGITQLEV